MKLNELYNSDLKRVKHAKKIAHQFRLLWWLRLSQVSDNKLVRILCKFRLKLFAKHYGIEFFPGAKIGKGLYLGHPYCITVNEGAVLGDNISLHKGVTIGQENRGKRKGTPTLGNYVWVGVNATIVGKINIGDDVLIAPNTYVNCDVPSHSVVFGNPCIIKPKENATEGYI